MGRPVLYKTEEEKKAAACERSRKYYERFRENISISRKQKYAAKRRNDPSKHEKVKVVKSDEERKYDNRQKSNRSYQRRKSAPKNEGSSSKQSKPASDLSTAVVSRRPPRDIWEGHTKFLLTSYKDMLENRSLREFLEDISARYIESGVVEDLVLVLPRLIRLREGVYAHEQDISLEVGAAAQLGELEALGAKIDQAVEMIQDLEDMARFRGHDEFIDLYSEGDLYYQRSHLLD